MNYDFEELKNLYDGIHETTIEISMLIKERNWNKIEEIIKERDILFKKTAEIKSKIQFSEEEIKGINSLIEKTRSLENDNIKEIEKEKELMHVEFLNINKSHKAISAYKYNKESEPRLFDSRE